jgi:predicted  nucleic acid-binding Zn-ribbon protein
MAFKDDVSLDVTTLDQAALSQPSLYLESGELWAKAVLQRDRLKERLSAKRAEVDEDVRNDPEKYRVISGTKITETWIANKVSQHEEVIALVDELNKAQYDVNMMAVAKESLDHRLKALNILSELYKGNYFSASSRYTEPYKKAAENAEEAQRKTIESSPRMQKLIKRRASNV